MSLLLIDNYDSFTYNIIEILRQIGVEEYTLLKNDELSVQTAATFDKIIISPGPSVPKESGNILDIIKNCSQPQSILGICLGHQAIAEAFGGTLKNYTTPQHGVKKIITTLCNDIIFENIPTQHYVGLYHSWYVDKQSLPKDLDIIAEDEQGIIMGLRHTEYDIVGIQFHPESYMTEHGTTLLKNWYFNK